MYNKMKPTSSNITIDGETVTGKPSWGFFDLSLHGGNESKPASDPVTDQENKENPADPVTDPDPSLTDTKDTDPRDKYQYKKEFERKLENEKTKLKNDFELMKTSFMQEKEAEFKEKYGDPEKWRNEEIKTLDQEKQALQKEIEAHKRRADEMAIRQVLMRDFAKGAIDENAVQIILDSNVENFVVENGEVKPNPDRYDSTTSIRQLAQSYRTRMPYLYKSDVKQGNNLQTSSQSQEDLGSSFKQYEDFILSMNK